MTPEELEEFLNNELPSNGKRLIKALNIRNVLRNFYSALQTLIQVSGGFENVPVNNITNGGVINHNLDSVKLEVGFYGADNRPINYTIDWEPLNNDSIRVYLPLGISGFTGDVFLKKRV